MRNMIRVSACLTWLIVLSTNAQERSQYQHWLELASADQTYADRSGEIGRTEAFREFLGQDSIVFRDSRGPVDALEEYLSANYRADELTWESHYIDVSRDGDLGVTAGPYEVVDTPRESDQYFFGHLHISKKISSNQYF